MGKRARSNEAEAEAPPPATEVVEHAAFGVFLWIELSVILSQRVLDRIQQCSMELFVLDDASERLERVEQLGKELQRTWLAARTIIPADEWSRCNSAVQVYMNRFMADLRAIVVAAKPRDVLALCRAIQRLLEESGFTEGENSCLDHYVADYRQQHELSCYSYSERASMAMPLLARYDGDKRTEAEHSRPRSGFMVVLPRVHDQPEINTQIQLIEPRKRRPPLDEYRIFSHPKKAATYGVEDFIVEEELMHRAYATLTMHMDVFGSFAQISPFCRFVLWSVVDRDDAVFRQLLHAQTNTEAMRQKMTEVRVLLDEKKRRFESCRASARTAAHHIGWFAVSAQWRDQIVSKWSEVEEGDWCCMCEVARLGGSAIFPNYSYSAAVSSMALNVIKKLDRCHKPSPPVLEVVERVLMPLLRGEAPPAAPDAISESGSFDRYVRRIHALASSKRLDVKTEVSSSARGPSSSSSSSGASTHHLTLILPSVVFPLQCLAELLELCSVALHSAVGIESFAKSFLATSWQDEDAILAYLIKKEPANTAIAPLAVLPKLYKDLLTGVELMGKDRLLPLVLAANRSTVSSHLLSRNTKDYVYWKALSMNLAEKDRYDDLVWLMVVPLSATSSLARPRREEPNLHLHYTTSTVERASKVWAEELRELIEAEKELELFTTPAA